MSWSQQRARRLFVYFMVGFLALPPGFGTSRLFAASRTSALTRGSKLETFRNPQISSSQVNRFLYLWCVRKPLPV